MNGRISYQPLIIIVLLLSSCADFESGSNVNPDVKKNILILHADQWRAQAFGYAGDPNSITPNIDSLAAQSANFSKAVSGMPVCTPHRASLLTGQRALTHGIFMNDVQLDTSAVTIAEILQEQGYHTGYIGKWHLDGSGRSDYTPPGPRRQGFEYWKALECSHNYNDSAYYHGDNPEKQHWEGYDAIAQTRDAQAFLENQVGSEKPFFLMLSWGTPHAPYGTAPERYKQNFDPEEIQLRPNVPESIQEKARKDLAGYYAHAQVLDDMMGDLRRTLSDTGLDQNTIVLFTSDHGDLIGSHGAYKKQQIYEESIGVPMLIAAPDVVPGERDALMNTEDILPTLLGLASQDIPSFIEGIDYSDLALGETMPVDTSTVISCIQPFGQWNRVNKGGREYRGLRSSRYTYAKDLNGPWLLFDNEVDPFQMENLVNHPEYSEILVRFDDLLESKLEEQSDAFLPGLSYVEAYNYPPLNDTETVPYRN